MSHLYEKTCYAFYIFILIVCIFVLNMSSELEKKFGLWVHSVIMIRRYRF